MSRRDNHLLAALEAAVAECRRLEEENQSLKQRLKISRDDTEHDEVKKPKRRGGRTYRPWQKKEEPKPDIKIEASARRNTNDLYKEARQKHEREVEEHNRTIEKIKDDPNVRVSEGKKQQLIESAQRAVNKSK